MPTLELPTIRIRFKDANYNATAGETIAGNLVRGANGKFASGGASTTSTSSKPSTVGKRNEARRYPNVAQLIGTADTNSLSTLAHSGAITGDAAQSLFKRGLAELDYTGNFRITAQGRAFLQAAGANNMERAKASLFRAQEIADRRSTLQNKKAQQAVAKLENKKKRDAAHQTRQQQQAQRKTDLQKKRDERANQRHVRIVTSQQKRDQRQQTATQRRAQRNTDLAAKRNQRSLEHQQREAAKRQREAARLQKAASKKKEVRIHLKAAPTPAEREKMPAGAFVFPGEKAFPVTSAAGIARAVSSWGRYRGPESFDTFKRNLTALAKRNGWESSLPAEWTAKKEVASLAVFKQADGVYRWVTFSSSGYKDHDGEIVSTKALTDDVSRADGDGDYGPLRWWHVPGLDIGDCDFNDMHGRILIESGTFRSPEIAEGIMPYLPELGVSIGFKHSPLEPDNEGVYHTIKRFERSLLPAYQASNPYTKLFISEGNTTMEKEKIGWLAKMLGRETVQALAEQATATQKEADAAGTTYKAAKPPIAPDDPAAIETKADGAMPDPTMGGDMEPDPGDPNEGAEPGEGYEGSEGDNAIDIQMQDLHDALDKIVLSRITEAIGPIKALIEGSTAATTKETGTLMTAMKELAGGIDAIRAENKTLKARIASLEGDLPKSEIEKRRATNSTANTEIPERLKEAQPKADPKNDFMGFFFGQEGLVKPN